MNRSWLTLVVIGILFLIATVGWELVQNLSGNRSNVVITVIDYQRDTLFSNQVKNHIESDKEYLTQ